MKKIMVENIEEQMVLAREVCGTNGNVLLSQGTVLTPAIGRRLQNWGIPAVYVEGMEEQELEENTVAVSPEELESHLQEKFSNTMNNPYMKIIFDAVLQYRLKKNGK